MVSLCSSGVREPVKILATSVESHFYSVFLRMGMELAEKKEKKKIKQANKFLRQNGGCWLVKKAVPFPIYFSCLVFHLSDKTLINYFLSGDCWDSSVPQLPLHPPLLQSFRVLC